MLTRGREAQARASPDTVLFPLPRCFVRAVFLLLPVDARLRCSEVSRAWRALLADTSFYERLDLSVSSGCTRFSLPLLRAAVAKAGGQLRAVDVTGQPYMVGVVDILREIIAANAATLTELRVVDAGVYWSVEGVQALLLQCSSPAFEVLEAAVSVHQDPQVARSMLRNEPPFQALRLRRLLMDVPTDVASFCSDLRVHASLEQLYLHGVALDTAVAMGAVVDACIAINLRRLDLRRCRVVPAALPELTRLVAAGALRALMVANHNNNVEVFDEAHESTRLFVAAVRASAMSVLRLVNVGVVPENVAEAAAFINASTQ